MEMEIRADGVRLKKEMGVFLSKQTESMFQLTAVLPGHTKENIKIEINEEGTMIAIEIQSLKKVLRIPDGVALDEINAKFNEDQSLLTITMPKKMRAVCPAIEEIKEETTTTTTHDHQLSESRPTNKETNGEEKGEESSGWKTCVPVIAGSALLMSLVVLVIQIMRTNTKQQRAPQHEK